MQAAVQPAAAGPPAEPAAPPALHAQLAPGAPPPPDAAARRAAREVRLLGRALPRALSFERVFWGLAAVGGAVVLALALWLKPDPRGIGTHEQLGLPPCGFVKMFDGVPCPSCGFTTTFTLAAHGRPVDAFVNQPFGFALFLVTLVGVPTCAVASARAVSLFELTERWRWGWIFLGFLGLWLLAWLYKWLVLMG